MFETIIFFIFAGFAIACAISLVYHKNPLYSAISLIGVFISLAGIYLTLAAPFIAAVQILVYAGAIMVLVVFVIMLLNLDEDQGAGNRLPYLYTVGAVFGLGLLAQAFFIYTAVSKNQDVSVFRKEAQEQAGLTLSIGKAMFTEYLLPFEIVGLLLLMAIVGAMLLTRRAFNPKLELVKPKEEEARDA
jgi:NADH-quinone oxidoreductase subunit J